MPVHHDIQPGPRQQLQALLRGIYGDATAQQTEETLNRVLEEFAAHHPSSSQTAASLSERDALLIAYADQVREPGAPPLRTLARFTRKHLRGVLSGVHLLPFFPWSSDDGFSVKDYWAVAPEYGTWDDIAAFRPDFDLMFDAVFNHASAQGDWFQKFLTGEPGFEDFFVTVEGEPNLTQVVRPRALPLLTAFTTHRGPVQVWTTFSADQVDVNIRNPRVLIALLQVLLFYVTQGARFIRLDAIAYLCKEPGTTCIHLPHTHQVIQTFRAALDLVAPHVQLITETNVPHAENISYFGNGTNEAQLVYNFALPPLVLHALLRGDASHLARWAASLQTPSDRTFFFNFLASHDGIGLNPARGILPPDEIQFLVDRCQAHGGFINYKFNSDGSKSPYEMNIVYFDALNDPAAREAPRTQVDRFMVAQSIMLSLAGMPGIYFHSLFGSRNDRQAALDTGINRRINRQKLTLAALESELADPASLRRKVFAAYSRMLRARSGHPAFNPRSAQQILTTDPRLFAVLRQAADGSWVLCLHNLASQPLPLNLPQPEPSPACTDLLTDTRHLPSRLEPYSVHWISGHGTPPGNLPAQ